MFIVSDILVSVSPQFLLAIFQCKIELWDLLLIDNLQNLYIFSIWILYFGLFKMIQPLVDAGIVWFPQSKLRVNLLSGDFLQISIRSKSPLKVDYCYTWYYSSYWLILQVLYSKCYFHILKIQRQVYWSLMFP